MGLTAVRAGVPYSQHFELWLGCLAKHLRYEQSSQQTIPLRPLTLRAHPLVFGVVLFLASELMLFAAMFAAYFDLRSINPVWPPADVHLHLSESTIGTIALALSSGSMLCVTRSLSRSQVDYARYGLFSTILLGFIFLGIAIHGWTNNTFSINSHAYGSLFYMITGFHALHVTIGVILLILLFFGLSTRTLAGEDRAGAEGITYYWHFVFIIWLAIYGTIYLVR